VPGNTTLFIPSLASDALTVAADSWFHLPFMMDLGEDAGASSGAGSGAGSGSGPTLAYATAQLLTSVHDASGTRTYVLTATATDKVELAVVADVNVTVVGGSASVSVSEEGGMWVARGIAPGTGVAVSVTKTGSATRSYNFVVLPKEMGDKVML
jgi:hypothetical protein